MTGKRLSTIYNCIAPQWNVVIWFLLLILLPGPVFAQNEDDSTGDEISVMVEVKGVGNTDMPAIIRDKDILLPVNMVFDFLKIKSIPSISFDTLSGFYVNERDIFLIDKANNRITFKDTVTNIKSKDMVKEGNNLYLNLKYFKPIFKLSGVFNFRTLSVGLTSDIELPAIREARQEMMRRNVNRLNGDIKADTTIKRTYPAFHFGAADWAVTSTQQSIGADATRLTLGLGAIVAGGEADASLSYFPGSPWDEKQQYYQWRYVNNDNPAVRQVMAGNIYTSSIASLYAPVVGVQFTNAPTTYRKAYGTYTLSNTTDPNWVVELYVNSVLVDYKKADAIGFYTFDVPLIYGYSIIKLKFFGPYGEERTTQTYINIPFNFLPLHEFEYTASAGVVEDGRNSIFSRVGFNYGLSGSITIGAGVEYLSSITSGSTIPFVNTSIKLAQNLLVSGEYDYGVRGIGVLSYRLPSNIQLDLSYTKYKEGQTAIYYNYLDERKATLSMPLHTSFITIFSRLSLDEITVPNAKYTNAEWTFTGTIKNVGINFSNYASFVQETTPYLYGLVSLTFPLVKKVVFTPQLQYDYKEDKPIFMKFTFEKHVLAHGYVSLSYQEFFNNSSNIEQSMGDYRNVLIGMRYDFSFTRIAASALVDNNKGYSIVESASGSLIYNKPSDYLNFNNRTNVGKAEVAFEPFLDINCNGIRDAGEPRVPGIKIQINGGRTIYDENDTVIRVLDLEPYLNYYISLSTNGLDNIAWQLQKHVLKVAASPNDFNIIEVPVFVFGEVSGIVSLTDKDGHSGKGERQMIVNIYDNHSMLVAHTITESDGFFSYIGLAPGNYTAQIDSGQLGKLHLKPKQRMLPIHIAQNKDGDIVDGLEFILLPNAEDTSIADKQKMASAKKEAHMEPVTTDKILPDSTHQVALAGLAVNIAKLYAGTIVCVINDENDIADLQTVNAKGGFLMYDYQPFHVVATNNAGIISQAIFLNKDLQIIEVINKRVIDGRYKYLSNNKEKPANRASVKIIADER
jgi:hypothetical protein